jgi:hypothetical protein
MGDNGRQPETTRDQSETIGDSGRQRETNERRLRYEGRLEGGRQEQGQRETLRDNKRPRGDKARRWETTRHEWETMGHTGRRRETSGRHLGDGFRLEGGRQDLEHLRGRVERRLRGISKSILMRPYSWRKMPANGSRNDLMAPRTTLGYPN